MTARPIRRNAQTPDRNGKIFYTSTTSLSHISKSGGLLPGNTQRVTNDLEGLVILFKAFFLIDLIRYNTLVRRMIRHTDELKSLFRLVGEVDVTISLASFRQSLPWYCTPVLTQEHAVQFTEVYHPLLKDPVANSGMFDNDCIITGSNASGKSTFIKTIAINHILAQTTGTCCARQYSLSPSYVASSMALKDDILSGESYFMAEVRSLKRIIEYCKAGRCICFVDEILRGTNTPERIAASTAVLSLLHETDSLCLVASHDIELTKILQGVYDMYHFSETFENETIAFDYRLKKGPSRSTNAIRLLTWMGFDPRIIEDATNMLEADEPPAP